MNFLNIIGLVLNFVGTILIVFYIRTDKNEWIENEQGQRPGERWYALFVKHPRWLTLGIACIAVGFLLSIIAEFVVCK